MPIRKNKIKRQCKECEEMYTPNNKYGKLCKECKDKAMEKSIKHGFGAGQWKKKKSKTTMETKLKILLCLTYLTFILLSINYVSALRVDYINAETILQGESSRIFIGIENDGDDDIVDVSVELDFTELPFAPYNSNSEYGINEIKDGKTETAVFEIISMNAKSGIYKIPLKISYKIEDETTVNTKESIISFVVNSVPIIKANQRYEIDEGFLLKGRLNEIIIDILNKGLSDVQFAEVEIGTSNYFDSLKSIQYIGDIRGDDYEYVDFKIYFKENAPRIVNIPVIVRYQDVFNTQYEKQLNIRVNTYTIEEAIAEGLMPKDYKPIMIGGGIGLVIVFILYRKIRKWMKNKNRNKELKDMFEEAGEK